MTREREEMFTFCIMIVSGAAIAWIIGWQAAFGFFLGVIATILAAVIVGEDFDNV